MKKTLIFKELTKTIYLFVLFCILFGCKNEEKIYKYANLSVSDIKDAYIYHEHPEIMHYLSDKEIEKTVKFLNNFSEIDYKKHDFSYIPDGMDIYGLHLITNNTTITINCVSMEYIVIDGDAYDIIYWFFPLRSIFSNASKLMATD